MNISLRLWQEEAYQKFEENNFRGIIKVATGKGKTYFGIYCIERIIERFPEYNICIIVPSKALLEQWEKELIDKEFSKDCIGLYYSEKKELNKKIIISIVDSFSLLDKNTKSRFQVIIADECHHYGSEINSRIFDSKYICSLGLSATPERASDEETKIITLSLGPIIYERTHLEDPEETPEINFTTVFLGLTPGESKRFDDLSNIISYYTAQIEQITNGAIRPNSDEYPLKVRKLAKSEGKSGSAEADKLLGLWQMRKKIIDHAENKIPLILKIIEEILDNKIIIFNESIEYTKTISNEINLNFEIESKEIHSQIPKKEQTRLLEEFRSGHSGIIVSPRILDEGVNVPDASVAIIASFTNSPRQMIQRIGRVLRNSPGKEMAKIYVLVIREVEEIKFFEILKKSGLQEAAINGNWLKYSHGIILDDDQSKELYRNYLDKIKRKKEEQLEKVINKMIHFENEKENDDSIIKLQGRCTYYNKYIDFIIENKDIISERLVKSRKAQLYDGFDFNFEDTELNNYGAKEFDIEFNSTELLLSLENITKREKNRIPIPDKYYKAIKNYINNDSFEINEDLKKYIIKLTDGYKPPNWPEELYNYIKDNMRKYIEEN